MPNKLAHFAIEAEDVGRARAFYGNVFGWTFKPWGPPDFYLIEGAGINGAIQKRTRPLSEGGQGFECSIAVDDLGETIKQIEGAGGACPEPPVNIHTVGRLAHFFDTEGNRSVVIQYTPEHAANIGL